VPHFILYADSRAIRVDDHVSEADAERAHDEAIRAIEERTRQAYRSITTEASAKLQSLRRQIHEQRLVVAAHARGVRAAIAEMARLRVDPGDSFLADMQKATAAKAESERSHAEAVAALKQLTELATTTRDRALTSVKAELAMNPWLPAAYRENGERCTQLRAEINAIIEAAMQKAKPLFVALLQADLEDRFAVGSSSLPRERKHFEQLNTELLESLVGPPIPPVEEASF
jgi:hypothetical protein